MANVYAVKSGNWSDTTVWNTSALPTSADDVYSNNFTVTIDQNITVLSLRNSSATGITLGGGFTVSGNFTLNTGQLFWTATGTLLTYTGSGTLNITGSIPTQTASSGGSNCILISGNGAVNFVGGINSTASASRYAINKTGTGKLTITGDVINSSTASSNTLLIAAGEIEIIGNINNQSAGGAASSIAVINYAGTSNVIITGQLNNSSTGTYTTGLTICVIITTNAYFKHVGTMNNTSTQGICYSNLTLGSINIATGPFISSPSAMIPFTVYRMNYQITALSYFEFRDSSTNGALPPSAAAPATKLVAPDTIVDAPTASNVRFGTTYALGTQTGTLRVPSPNSVAFGVLTDNTTGTAVLTPQAVWDYATSSLTTAGSIGERLKNASTVDTTGDQLAALL